MKAARSKTTSVWGRITLMVGIARLRPVSMSLSIFGLLIAALLEGIGILALLPVIGVFLDGASDAPDPDLVDQNLTQTFEEGASVASDPHPVVQTFTQIFESVGLELTLGPLLLFILAVVVLKAVVTLLAQMQVAIAQSQTVESMRHDLIGGLLRARWEFFTRQPTGRLSNAIVNESQSSGQLYSQFAEIVATTLQATAYLIAALLISWQVTLGAIAVGGIMVLLLSGFISSTQRNAQRMTTRMSGFTARLIDSLMGMKPLKAMHMAGHLQPILHKDIRTLRQVLVKLLLLKKFLTTAQEVIRSVALVGVIYVFTLYKPTSVEGLLAIAYVFVRTIDTFGRFQKQWQSVAHSEAPYRHVVGLREYARANQESDLVEIADIRFDREIRFENVGFAYSTDGGEVTDLYFRASETEAPTVSVLKDMNLRIRAGEFLCLLGGSGAGKTTLADLLIGLIVPQQGRILVDDTPLEAFKQEAWRRSIGYVPQDVFLFNGTIRDNITMGDGRFGDAELTEAVARAGAEDFIAKLDRGLDTQVGERGIALSGGQRQRICIARALVRRPRLLILDEATSALDSVTEKEIAETVRSLTPQVTVVAITHRPALADMADTVVDMADGAVKNITDLESARNAPAAVIASTERG